MALKVQEVSVSFGGLAALSNVSLEVPDGAITGLIGPNGAGKTTLFDVITGTRRPNRGSVIFNGRDMRGVSAYRRSRLGLGRTFQRLELFGTLTVRENVRVAASIGHGRARRTHQLSPFTTRAARSTESESVDELTDRLLEKVHLEDVAETRADTLPTGKGRLVELARALAVHPKTLLLDEPASGQNPDEASRFGGILRSLSSEGLAVMLVEHDMDLVMSVCDIVFVLVQGTMLCSGTPAEVQRNSAVAEAYLGSLVEVEGG